MEPVTEELTSPQDNKAELCVVMVILAILSVTGTAGNALVLYVFARKRDKLVSTLFMIVLALVDFVTCLVIMPLTTYMEYYDFHVTSDLLCKVYQFLITSNIPFSALIMVAIAVDRYLSICHPFLQALNPPRAKFVIGCLALLAAGLGICVSLIYSVYQQDFGDHVTEVTEVIEGGHSADVVVSRSPAVRVVERVIVLQRGFEPESSTVIFPEVTTNWTVGQQQQPILVNIGECVATDRVLSRTFQYYFQKSYNTLFVVCLVIVVVLYTLIYRSVRARRERRQSQKSQALPLVVSLRGNSCAAQTSSVDVKVKAPDEASLITDDGRLTCSDEDPAALPLNGSRTPRKRGFSLLKGNSRRKRMMLDANRMANLRTAVMLFVVTVTFIVTFAPAFLMTMDVVPYNIVVFYLYFANNVANPVIYSFMNNNFRQDLKKLFTATCRSAGHL